MISGLYSSVSSMIALESKLKITSNNIANINTPGYKYIEMVTKPFDPVSISNGDTNKEIGNMNYGVRIDDTITNFNQGVIVESDSKTDFAINGNGFFTVQDENGNDFYTRNGNFMIDTRGDLVTSNGYYVMGRNINNNSIERINIGNGNIDFSNGNININSIPTYNFNIVDKNDSILKVGENLYSIQNADLVANPNILQKNIETSNVDMIKEVTSIMEITKMYETNQKVIQTIDSILAKGVSEIGRVK